jgi:proteasome lid subunit RPN8/RPN11
MELPAEIRRMMVGHSLVCHPEEACGLLAADESGRLRRVYCLTNADRSPVTYTLEPQEHLQALRDAEGRGWHLAGVFHSHPEGRAHPSPTDVARALEPDWLYVVVGLSDRTAPEVRGFWIRRGHVEEEPFVEQSGEAREGVPGGRR